MTRHDFDQLGVLLPRPATRRELTRDTAGLAGALLAMFVWGSALTVALLVLCGVLASAGAWMRGG